MKKIHVICFQVPYPPTYGGVIDVYYKLTSLKEAGYYTILHTFRYKHKKFEKELLAVADEVLYYPRETSFAAQLSTIPYIVNSRRCKRLLADLQKDDFPILFEGLHSCFFLSNKALENRLKMVRTHNIEHEYYRHLRAASHNLYKKAFYTIESIKLERYENMLAHANYILPISKNEQMHFARKYPESNTIYLPCFFEQKEQTAFPGNGHYVLYQGNLAVEENIKAVRYLLKEIIPNLPYIRFVIAGANPNKRLLHVAKGFEHVKIVPNPSDEELEKLITNARINLLLTFQNTGIKLKLLNALYKGGYCLVNTPMVSGTGLDEICEVANEPQQIIASVQKLSRQPYTAEIHEKKMKKLKSLYDNTSNIQIIDRIFEENHIG